MQRVHPNKDVPAIGCGFSYQNASETVCAICSPEGAFLGSMRTERIRTFQLRHYGSLDLDDFGSLLDTRMDLNLNYILLLARTATSLCKASQLLSSVRCMLQLNFFRLGVQYQPNMEALMCTSCRTCRVWCSLGCILVHLAGQLLLFTQALWMSRC